ncbi:MAG: Smr/MutS family protein, partial [Oscillospiraceae bacterium]|nr:Smr/MutS family protein [Oscillospiraceae bacterium]
LRDAQEDRKQAEVYKDKLDKEKGRAADIAKREAAKILDSARAEAESVMAELQALRRKAASNASLQELNDEKSEVFRRLNEAAHSLGGDDPADEQVVPQRKLVPGDKVRLRSLGTFADVISISSEGVLSLQAGIMKITAHKDEVALVPADQQPEVKKQLAKSNAKLRELTAKPELDLRGMLTDEAIPILERFLDSARMAKLSSVTVIHGKGTGALRRAVHQSLKREQRGIKSFRLGLYGEGEDGVTIVEF